MTAADLVTDLTRRGVRFALRDGRLVIEAHGKVNERDLAALREHKATIVAALSRGVQPATGGHIAAVRLRSAVLDQEVWVIEDDSVLTEYPEIRESRLLVLYFDELPVLEGKTPDEARAIAAVKQVLPGSRVLQ